MATATATKARSKTATKTAAKKTVRRTTKKVARKSVAKTAKKAASKKTARKTKKLSVKGSNRAVKIRILDNTTPKKPKVVENVVSNEKNYVADSTPAVTKTVTKTKATVSKKASELETKNKTIEKSSKKQKLTKGLVIKDLNKEMKALVDWELNKAETQIAKTFLFPNFVSALAFVAKVTVHAEVLSHHPDIELSYGKVKVKLTTHETSSLTKLDFALAERIDGIQVRM